LKAGRPSWTRTVRRISAITLGDLAAAALARIGGDSQADVLCCALAGARGPAERAALADALAARGVARHIHIVTDAEAAMWDAFRGGPGILVIAGTGSVVWGTGVDGRTLRVGGWGHLLGDEGSGYAIGLGALRELARTADGWSEGASLADRLLPAMGIDGFGKLVHWTTAAKKREIAALAPLVLAADDEAARRVVRQAAAELAQQIWTATRLLEPWTEPVSPPERGPDFAGRPFREHLLAALAQPPCHLPADTARGRWRARRGPARARPDRVR
jgi:N-acetylglucosamine kinase-like BadF-type ATPase